MIHPHGTVCHQHYGHQTCRRAPSSGTENAPVLDRPAPLRRFHDSGVGYKYPDLLTYWSTKLVSRWWKCLLQFTTAVHAVFQADKALRLGAETRFRGKGVYVCEQLAQSSYVTAPVWGSSRYTATQKDRILGYNSPWRHPLPGNYPLEKIFRR